MMPWCHVVHSIYTSSNENESGGAGGRIGLQDNAYFGSWAIANDRLQVENEHSGSGFLDSSLLSTGPSGRRYDTNLDLLQLFGKQAHNRTCAYIHCVCYNRSVFSRTPAVQFPVSRDTPFFSIFRHATRTSRRLSTGSSGAWSYIRAANFLNSTRLGAEKKRSNCIQYTSHPRRRVEEPRTLVLHFFLVRTKKVR